MRNLQMRHPVRRGASGDSPANFQETKKAVLQFVWVRHIADVGAGPVPARWPGRATPPRKRRDKRPPGRAGWHRARPYTGGVAHTIYSRANKTGESHVGFKPSLLLSVMRKLQDVRWELLELSKLEACFISSDN